MAAKPYGGDVFVFRSKRSDRLKLLIFDGKGLDLANKWLEDLGFAWPPVREGTVRVTGAQSVILIEGLGVVARGSQGDEPADERRLKSPCFCWRFGAFSGNFPAWRFALRSPLGPCGPRDLRSQIATLKGLIADSDEAARL